MSRLRAIAQAALVVVLAINPIVAWWASSHQVRWVAELACGFIVFYVSCAVVLRSRMITGAILGGIFGAAVCVRPVISSRAEQHAELLGICVFVLAGAIWAAAYEWDRSQSAEDLHGNPEASTSNSAGDEVDHQHPS